ncbi:hypothetical protein BHM03_00039303 [Ensete ventricosum]|nr:hypothetical protein BHM03_00039303 [Ensete ventricosum]
MGPRVSVLLVVRWLWSSEHLGSACLHVVVRRRWLPYVCTAVADICRKMAAKRSESKGSSDSGGRKGQQRSQLRLQCDFVAADGVGCSKGAAVIGGRRGSDVHGCCGGGQQRLQRKIVAGSFLPQGLLLAVIKEDGSERSLLAALGIERCVLRLKG